jgi:hypothetical protein
MNLKEQTLPRHDLMTTDTDLAALDRLGRQIDAVWVREAASRFAAYKRGEIAAYDESEVFSDLDNE